VVIRFIVAVMCGVESSSFELVFPGFQSECSVFAADDAQLANQVVVVDKMLRVEV
jgi:hypothetical protein